MVWSRAPAAPPSHLPNFINYSYSPEVLFLDSLLQRNLSISAHYSQDEAPSSLKVSWDIAVHRTTMIKDHVPILWQYSRLYVLHITMIKDDVVLLL